MNNTSWSVFAGSLALLSSSVFGEIITGNGYPTDFLEFPAHAPSGGFVAELGLSFNGYNEFAGSGFTNYLLAGEADSADRTLKYLESSNNTGLFTREYFTEGQSLMNVGNIPIVYSDRLLALENSGFWDYAGADGEMMYIGFVVETDSGTSVETNYGFLQLLHETELDYRVIGWAYETESGEDLVTFNVPSPSGVAIFGLAGLGITRRRRI
jgi:hypothetical protein